MATNTPKLGLLLVQETWQFGDKAFNDVIMDADNKLVGVSHLEGNIHWDYWKAVKGYSKYDIVRVTNGKSHQYYKCIVPGISGLVEPTNNVTGTTVIDGTVTWIVESISETSDYTGMIQVWSSGHYYDKGDAVIYGSALYRSSDEHISSNDFSLDKEKWQEVFASIREWSPQIYYYVSDVSIHDGFIYRCIQEHKSEVTFSESEKDKWELLSGSGSGLEDWKPLTSYSSGDYVVYNNKIYRCNSAHISRETFMEDAMKWDVIGGGGGGSGTGYSQVTKYVINVPCDVDIHITSNDFCMPPVEVLKFYTGEAGVTVNEFNFDIGDGSNFIVNKENGDNSKFVAFDGTAHLKDVIIYKFKEKEVLGNGYSVVTRDSIDLNNDFISVSWIEVV